MKMNNETNKEGTNHIHKMNILISLLFLLGTWTKQNER